MPLLDRNARHALAVKRLRSVLESHTVANDRILEQKISDAGPTNQRIDPHILTPARQTLVASGEVIQLNQGKVPWYHLAAEDPRLVAQRFADLDALHKETIRGDFSKRLGQTLEIAVYRALNQQHGLEYFGSYPDLDAHDDSTLYTKIEPPAWISGRDIGYKRIDFLVSSPSVGFAGIEVKNIRQWIYPSRDEIREMLFKCCTLNVVPVLIARRIHYSTFSVLNPCGIIIHQTFNQLYPESANDLAEQVKRKDLLGYHDVRVGNQPDDRLLQFIEKNLALVLPEARQKFDRFHDLLYGYATGEHTYKSFAARVKRRMRGVAEDLPLFEEEPEAYEPGPDWET